MMSFIETYNSLSFFICENAFPWTDIIALLLRSLGKKRKIGLEENNNLLSWMDLRLKQKFVILMVHKGLSGSKVRHK